MPGHPSQLPPRLLPAHLLVERVSPRPLPELGDGGLDLHDLGLLPCRSEAGGEGSGNRSDGHALYGRRVVARTGYAAMHDRRVEAPEIGAVDERPADVG